MFLGCSNLKFFLITIKAAPLYAKVISYEKQRYVN